MAGYSRTPLWKKLGVKPGGSLVLLDAPRGWSVPDLPEDVSCSEDVSYSEGASRGVESAELGLGDTAAEIVVVFCPALERLRELVPALARRIFPDGAIWVAWPRRAGGHDSDIRDQDIRDVALPLGLVDVKVAALDEDWSGLRLVWRRERR